MGQEMELTAADGGRFSAYLATPASTPVSAPGLIVLPEVFNTNAHIRSVADQYAAAGYLAIAPDVYWRQAPGSYQEYTDEGFERSVALRERLDPDQFTADIGDIVRALRARCDCTGKIGVMGFCLGGRFTFLASTRLPIDAAVSYYGTQIDRYLDEAQQLRCPVLLHFAANDEHVPGSSVEAIQARLGARADVQIHLYEGAGHGFNRAGYPSFNASAAAIAGQRTLAHFQQLLMVANDSN